MKIIVIIIMKLIIVEMLLSRMVSLVMLALFLTFPV